MYNGGPCFQFVKDTGVITSNIAINFVFQTSTPTYIPTATVASDDTSKGAIASNGLTFVENTETASTWTLTATPAAGYHLAYIQVGEDTTTRVDSDDGATITWDVTANAEYTAYFEAVTMHLTDSVVLQQLGTFGDISSSQTVSDPVSVGQRVGIVIGAYCPSGEPDSMNLTPTTYPVYAGENTSGTLLGTFINPSYSIGTSKLSIVVDPMPAVSQITVSAQIGDGDVVTKTYTITAPSASGSTGLVYMTTPDSATAYPTDSCAVEKGPNVYAAAAFTDESTGALSMYLGVSGGVMKYSADSSTDFTYMSGMSFGYRDGEVFSGYAFAIGGTGKDHLAALVKDTSDPDNTVYCVYTYDTSVGTWTKVIGSKLGSAYTFGLVMSQTNIWVSDKHWDGTSWTANTVTFNSFWKDDADTAYAGSADGIYMYDGSTWTKVSNTSGSMVISSACQNSNRRNMTWSAFANGYSSTASMTRGITARRCNHRRKRDTGSRARSSHRKSTPGCRPCT